MFDKLMRVVAKAAAQALIDAVEEASGNDDLRYTPRRDEGARRRQHYMTVDEMLEAAEARRHEKADRRAERWAERYGRNAPHTTADEMLEAAEAKRSEQAERRANRWGERYGRSAPPRTMREECTAVLRRQVPPRDEPPRSWIGGLPMLPDHIEWPRARNSDYPDKGEIPLNFAAQIACADLPANLWGGLGPRDGWLVFFVATWGCASFEDKDSLCVFHISELGSERQAPADKLSVGDPMYSGGDNPALNYERWPVDIIEVSNKPDFPSGAPWTDNEPVSPIPPDFATVLYDGAPVAKEHWHPKDEPFNWGAVRIMLERTLASRVRKVDRPHRIDRLEHDGRDHALAALKIEEAKLDGQPEGLDPERQLLRKAYVERRRAEIEAQRSFLANVGEPFDPDRLTQMIEQSLAGRQLWLKQQEDVMAELLNEASSYHPRTPISLADQERIATLFSAGHDQWHIDRSFSESRVRCPRSTTLRLSDLLRSERIRSVAIAARDLYRAGPQDRESLPADMRLALEADLRQLEDNRPHRLGGIFQPVQDTNAPPGKMLLLQLGNDHPTGFHWGDSGALFAWIDIDALEKHDFGQVQWWTENT